MTAAKIFRWKFLALVPLIILGVVFYGYRERIEAKGVVIIANTVRVNVDIAADSPARAKGLSGRGGLAADEGMFFLFPSPGVHKFWMNGMKFPIDIIWIRNGAIIGITENLPTPQPGEPPPIFAPSSEVDSALEVTAGFSKKHLLKIGMAIQVDKR